MHAPQLLAELASEAIGCAAGRKADDDPGDLCRCLSEGPMREGQESGGSDQLSALDATWGAARALGGAPW